jgi:hypothetical protein
MAAVVGRSGRAASSVGRAKTKTRLCSRSTTGRGWCNLAAMKTLISLAVFFLALQGCAKHECKLESDADKQAFGGVAEMTGGAFSCFVSNGELVASHGDTNVAAVTDKYKAWLEKAGYKVEVKDHKGQRSNGKAYEGKMLMAEKDGKKVGTLIYELGDKLVETVIVSK